MSRTSCLRVVAAVRRGRSDPVRGRRPAGMRQAPTSRQARVLADLEPPALVVRQVPVQHVELVQRHPVDELPDEFGRLVVPRRIEHQSAPGEARRVVDPQRLDRRGAGSGAVRGGELPKRDGPVEEAARIRGADLDAARRHLERVRLRGPGGRCVERKPDAAAWHRPSSMAGAGCRESDRAGPAR